MNENTTKWRGLWTLRNIRVLGRPAAVAIGAFRSTANPQRGNSRPYLLTASRSAVLQTFISAVAFLPADIMFPSSEDHIFPETNLTWRILNHANANGYAVGAYNWLEADSSVKCNR